MSPPEPPRRRPPGGLLEENASVAPHTPVPPPIEAAPTARPPAPDPRPPPRHLAKPRVVVPPLSAPRAPGHEEHDDERTMVGLGPSEPPPSSREDGDRDSTVQAVQAAHTLSGELSVKVNELAWERARREQLERQLADFERRLERSASETERPPTPVQWKSLGFKAAAALVAFIAAATVALDAYTRTLQNRVENVAAKQTTQEAVTNPLPSKVSELELAKVACRDYAKAREAYDRSVLAAAGIVVPAPEGAAQAPALKFGQVPLRRAGVVTSGPLVRVETAPPPLP